MGQGGRTKTASLLAPAVASTGKATSHRQGREGRRSKLYSSCDMTQKEEVMLSHQFNLPPETKLLGSLHWEQTHTLFCFCVELGFNKASWAADTRALPLLLGETGYHLP